MLQAAHADGQVAKFHQYKVRASAAVLSKLGVLDSSHRSLTDPIAFPYSVESGITYEVHTSNSPLENPWQQYPRDSKSSRLYNRNVDSKLNVDSTDCPTPISWQQTQDRLE